MKRLKDLMKGYKTRTFGNYKVIKQIAHKFDQEINEQFYYIYTIEKIA